MGCSWYVVEQIARRAPRSERTLHSTRPGRVLPFHTSGEIQTECSGDVQERGELTVMVVAVKKQRAGPGEGRRAILSVSFVPSSQSQLDKFTPLTLRVNCDFHFTELRALGGTSPNS